MFKISGRGGAEKKNLKDKFYHCFVNFQNIFPIKPNVFSFHADPSPDTTSCMCRLQGGWAVFLVSISMARLQALSKGMGGWEGGGSKLFPTEKKQILRLFPWKLKKRQWYQRMLDICLPVKEMYQWGSSSATVWAWLGISASLKMMTARLLTFFLPVILWSWKCFQKHSWAFLITSLSINLRRPESGILLKWASILQSFFSFLSTVTLPFPRPGGEQNESVSLNLTAIII